MTDNPYDQFGKYIKQLESLSSGLSANIKPIIDQQEQIFSNLSKDIRFSMVRVQPPSELLKIANVSMNAWPKMLQSSLNSTLIASITNITKNVASLFTEEFLEKLERLPIRMQKALIVFAENGWYFDLDMSLEELWGLEAAFIKGRTKEAEDALSSYFEKRLDAIEYNIKDKFSHRSVLITEAFDAHKSGKYSLSILALFAQTDGICKEIFGQNLFCGGKKFDCNYYVEQITYDSLLEVLISPLKQSMPVNLNLKERDVNFEGLNRHMVMHGESLDYGTKTNSLKAISLFNYVSQVLEKQ